MSDRGSVPLSARSQASRAPSTFRSQSRNTVGPVESKSRTSFMSHSNNSVMGRKSKDRRSTRMSHMRRKGKGFESTDEQVQVLDASGRDVTPKPLLSMRPTVLHERDRLMHTPSAAHSPVSELNDSYDRASSIFSYSRRSSISSMSADAMEEVTEEDGDPEGKAAKPGNKQDESNRRASGAEPRRTPVMVVNEAAPMRPGSRGQDFEGMIRLRLRETPTVCLLHLPGDAVSTEDPGIAAVTAANDRYAAQVAGKAGSENFVGKAAQTLPSMMKAKEVQMPAVERAEAACQSSSWELYDAFEAADAAEAEAEEREAATEKENNAAGPAAQARTEEAVASKRYSDSASAWASARTSRRTSAMNDDAQSSFGGMDGVSVIGGGTVDGRSVAADTDLGSLLPEEEVADLTVVKGLDKALQVMERALAQNVFHSKLIEYRDFHVARPPPQDEDTPADPSLSTLRSLQSLSLLWEFSAEITDGRQVSGMTWNKGCRDMLAVGYGQFEFEKQRGGLIAFWSLKNPQFPEWTISTEQGVTALDFSAASPNLLAVGFYDGAVAIYDVRAAATAEPLYAAVHGAGKHTEPVWKLKWVDRGQDRGEQLVSISTDGRVTQWALKKGLEYSDLIKLKRVARRSKAGSTAQAEAFISRKASGMCFDFSPADPSIYIAGTEEGALHACSCSYSEQYLRTYVGHTGPVYQAHWSPFAPNLFLTASDDWTIRLWAEDQETPLLVFQTGTHYVSDVQWSPTNSTIFASANGEGKLEIWDLAASVIKPVLSHSVLASTLSTVLFAEDAPIVLAGDSNGGVSVFKVTGVEPVDDLTREEQRARLEACVGKKKP